MNFCFKIFFSTQMQVRALICNECMNHHDYGREKREREMRERETTFYIFREKSGNLSSLPRGSPSRQWTSTPHYQHFQMWVDSLTALSVTYRQPWAWSRNRAWLLFDAPAPGGWQTRCNLHRHPGIERERWKIQVMLKATGVTSIITTCHNWNTRSIFSKLLHYAN